MGKPNNKNVLRLVSIIIALAMIVPGVVLTQQFRAESTGIQPDAQGPTTYAWVNYNSPDHANAVRDMGANIVSLRETGAYVRITESQRSYLSERFVLTDMPRRTTVNLFEQGISFDSQVGYELADEWRNPNSNEYLVQFVAPTETAWNDGVVALSGKILREIGNNLIVVKMTENQKANVEKLSYVQWVGVYEPGFKMDKEIPSAGIVKITVDAYEVADTAGIISKLTELGATEIEDCYVGSINAYIDASMLPDLAKLDSVKLVWYLGEMKTLNNVGGRIVQAHDLWTNTVSNFPSNIMGAGQIVHVQDTGLDATHRDFTSGPLGNRILFAESATDTDYHGTHCIGTVAGNGYDMEAYLGLSTTNQIYNELAASNPAGRADRMGFAGRAPEATISSGAGLSSNDWAAGYTRGARVFSNSWGPASMSNAYDSTADTFMTTNPLALVLFAIGNDGPRTNTASGGGNGKLGVGVGAVENMRPVDFDSSDDYNQQIGFSSRGPVADGRIKPDVCEIGTAVYSTLSDDSAAANAGYELYNLVSIINTDTSDTLGDYLSLQGTSMACPAAAGDSVLIRDYLQDVLGIATGSIYGLTMKGLLIHGAEDMGLGYPSYDQGWGRVNVRNSVAPAFPNVLQWYYHATGIASGTWNSESVGLDAWVIDRTVPLKVTLVHNDASGSGELTYDLDLRVTAPDGAIYWGNAFRESESIPMTTANDWSQCAFPSWVGGNAYDFDEADDGGDDENNVEVVLIPANKIRLGQYRVDVVWKESTARPFFIAMTGGFNASRDVNQVVGGDNTYRVNMNLDVPRVVPERDDFGEAVFKCAPSGSVIVPYWINNGGITNDAYALSTPILPTGFTVTFTSPASPASVNANSRVHGYVRIAVAGTVTAGTYTLAIRALSNNDGSAPVAQSQIKFQIDVVTDKTPPVIPVANSPAHEDAPYFVSWYASGKDYIAGAYRQDEQFGERVYFTLSDDGGRTWSKGIPISQRSWAPGYVGITRATSGPNEGRLVIAYNSWNPDGYLGSTADTRCSYVKTHYSDFPYTTWTEVNAFSLGEGAVAGGANTYRTIDINWVPSVGQFYLTVEDFGYSGTDLNTASQTTIATVGKYSTDGTAYTGYVRIDPAAAGMYYFFPSTEIDMLGNMVLFFYERDSGDAAQDRDATFKYYNGAWSTMKTVWDTTDNLMMPQTTTSNEGANGNRAYGAYLKGANTDGDREFYLTYTDNPDGATPVFTTNLGPYGPIMSDHDYGTRFIWDLEFINSYLYFFGHRQVAYDPYGQPNMLMIHDDDVSTAPVPVVDYLTLDSFVHGKQRAAKIVGENKVFIAQNTFTKNVGHDILGQIVHYNWRADIDTYGPVTEFVSTSNQVMAPGTTFNVVANVHDWQTGGNFVGAARYRTDVNPGTYVNMASMDGSFNSPAEAVTTSAAVSTTGWTGGWHTIWVSGRDNSPAQNWGAEEAVQILIVAPEPPFTPTEPIPNNGATNVPVSQLFSVYYEDYENNAGTVRFYWKDNPTQFATISGVASKTRAQTGAIALTGATTYQWYVEATDATGTTRGPATGYWTFTTIDNVPPAAVTNLDVIRDGPALSSTIEQRFMRGVANEGGVTGYYLLGTTQSATAGSVTGIGNNVALYGGIRVWKRSAAGTETEITSGTAVAIAYQTGVGLVSSTWTPPVTALDPTDSIVVRIYVATTTPPGTLRATWMTDALGATQLDASEWTMTYYLARLGNLNGGSSFFWGTSTYNTNVAGFAWSAAGDPTDHNTISWTKSADDGAGSNDVLNYKIYRAAVSGGPWTTLIATVPAGTTSYVDIGAGAADLTLWWYVVRATDITGNTETNINAVQELGGTTPAYEIALTGITAGNWAFVSFPSGATGPIESILTDGGVDGDGLTTWDVAKWYNPLTPADPWKTYRVGGTANDMPSITNGMGFWIRLTANGGDQMLTLANYVAIPASTGINLRAGWNLVGYPSMTATTGASLPAAVDTLSVYSGSATYTDYIGAAIDPIAISNGHAYFMHSTADTVWTVTNP